MYDTIRGYIITKDDLTKYLENISTYKIDKETGQELIKGICKSLTFYQNADGYSFSGSLTNSVLGHNFTGITLQQTKELIQDISTTLNLDFSEAKLRRIDFGNCFEVEDIPESYFQILGFLDNRLLKTQMNSTLYYGFLNNYRSLIFYDKVKDYKSSKLEIPENKRGENSLRYELKYKRTDRLKKLHNKEKIIVKDLTDQKVFNSLLDDWLNLYTSIQKEPKESITMSNQQLGLTGLNNILLKYHISSLGGLSGFREWLELETKKGNFKKGTYKKAILDKAKSVCNIEAEIDKDTKIQELDSKIKEIANNCRC